MKMKLNIKNKKLLIILLYGFVLTTLTGCKNNKIEININNNTQTTESTTTPIETTEEYTETDKKTIETLEKLERELNEILESDKQFLDDVKGSFITIVDFIFFDSEINGVKFDDLTDAGKQKVLEISSNIDTKIESKYPNYKETISEKTKDAFNKAGILIKEGANNINEFAKEKLGEENYNNIIESKDELIKYTKNALKTIGEFSSDLYESGKQKVKEWYNKFNQK